MVVSVILFIRVVGAVGYVREILSVLWQSHYNTWSRSWLRHCAISRQVAVSIPGGVIGIFR